MAWPNTVRKSDLNITWFHGSGSGGQHRNKHANCCRMAHIPTGIVVVSQNSRSRVQNQRDAFIRLVKQLKPIMLKECQAERYSAGTERIRTYHEADDRVTDTRVSGKQWSFRSILDGDKLSDIIERIQRSETV
jgi:peptide chain release factor 1